MRGVVLILVTVAFFPGPSDALAYVGVIGQMSTSGQVTEHTVGVPARPGAITSGPDGNLWFTANRTSGDDGSCDATLGRITTAGQVTAFTAGLSLSCRFVEPPRITSGPDGNVWFTEKPSRMGRITPDGTITEFGSFDQGLDIGGITDGPDGNLWFVTSRHVGRITPSGTITLFAHSVGVSVVGWGIDTGPDGNLWFTEGDSLGTTKIGRLTPAGSLKEFDLRVPFTNIGAYTVRGMAAAADGNLWFLARYFGDEVSVGRITPAGDVAHYVLPTVKDPTDITSGPDGNVWIAAGSTVFRVTSAGSVTAFPVYPSCAAPGVTGITAGPDGNLWFTALGCEHTGPPDPAKNFGSKTRVRLKVAATRIAAGAPLKVRVINANIFAIRGSLSAETAHHGPISGKGGSAHNSAFFSLRAQARKTVAVTLPKPLRRQLGRAGRVALILVASVKDPAGTRRGVEKNITVRLRPPP